MKYVHWNCPDIDGGINQEIALCFDRSRKNRLLILPALFDEANKMRRHSVELMRRLDLSGIDCFLPDLPGCNESLSPLRQQSLDSWKDAAGAAARHFAANRILTIRAGALLAPDGLSGWRQNPVSGRNILRSMLRAQVISARENGREVTTENLQQTGRNQGLDLAGWSIGPTMFAQLEAATPADNPLLIDIDQSLLGGSGLWLRAEPDEDPEQTDALAAIIAVSLESTDETAASHRPAREEPL
ncbi:MAG: hypothetical protein ACK5NN_01220 [Sphingomonadaceae bacterium]